MKHKGLIIASSIVAILVLIVLLLPLFFDANTFRPRVEAELSSALGRQVTIGSLKLAIFSGGLAAETLAIADDPAFSRDSFVRAAKLEVGADLGALIFSHQLHIRSLTLDDPELILLHTPAGKWNFSSLGSQNKSAGSGAGTPLSVDALRISNGKVSMGRVGAAPQTYTNVNIKAEQVAYERAFPFSVDATPPGGGKIHVDGHAGPVNRSDSSDTPFDANVRIEGMDLASSGMAGADSGIAGKLDYTGAIRSDGSKLHSEGTANTSKLRLVKNGTPAPQPVTVNYVSDYDMHRQAGTLTRGELRTGKAVAHVAGDFQSRGDTQVLQMKVTGKDLPVQDLAALLPAMGVSLPAGSSLQGGGVTTDLSLQGPVDKLVTTGTLQLDNVRLAGFSLGQKMKAVAALAGINAGADTMIQAMSSRLRVAPEGIRADDLSIVVPEIGTVTGAGTVAPDKALNFRMLAKVNSKTGSMLGGLTQIAGLGQAANGGGIPFLVQGTTDNPKVVPDVGGMLKGRVGNQLNAQPADQSQGLGGLLGGILGKKKKQQ